MEEVSRATFPKFKIWLTLILCGVECLLYGATLTGWASILYVFKEDGVFSHLCDNFTDATTTLSVNTEDFNDEPFVRRTLYAEGTTVSNTANDITPIFPRCSEQDRMFSLVFTIALTVWGLVGIPMGWFFDKYGLLKTRIISVICGILGFMMFAWAGPESYFSYLIFPGSVFQVFCAFITVMTCAHMATLAGHYASTALALYCGGGNSSVIVFLIVKLLHAKGISRKITLTIIAALQILLLLCSIFLMPHYKVVESSNSEKTNTYEFDNKSSVIDNEHNGIKTISVTFDKSFDPDSQEKKLSSEQKKMDEMQGNAKSVQVKTPTLWQCMKTPPFILICVWFAITFLAYFTFIGTYNPWVTKLAKGDYDIVDNLTNVLAYCQMSSLIVSLVPGTVTDFVKRKLTDRGDMTQGAATVPASALCCMMIALLHVCVIINRITVVSVSAIVSEVARSFLFFTVLTFIALTFPGQHFGKLYGISYCIAGVVNLLQYPLFIWADSSNSYFGMSITLLVASVFAFSLPVYMLIYRIRASQKKIP